MLLKGRHLTVELAPFAKFTWYFRIGRYRVEHHHLLQAAAFSESTKSQMMKMFRQNNFLKTATAIEC